MTSALTFAVLAPTLYAAHHVGDYWVQTHHQAQTKGNPLADGFSGNLACLRHVATYTVTTALFVGVVWWLLDLDLTWAGFVAGQLVSAITHYVADRRWPIEGLADLIDPITGKADFYELGRPRVDPSGRHNDNPTLGTGAHALDQSWHIFWLFIAALLTALI